MAAKDILDFAGWEYGCVDPSVTSTGGTGGSAVMAGTAIVTGQYGRPGRQLRHSTNGKGCNMRMSSTAAGGVNTAVLVLRLYFAVSSLPSGQNTAIAQICDNGFGPTKTFVARLKPSGLLECGYNTGNTPCQGALAGTQTGTVQICPASWNRLEMKVDVSGTTWLCDWQINGVSQPQVAITGQVATTWDGTVCGGGVGGDNSSSGTLYTDDFAIANSAAPYPLGPGYTRLVVPVGAYTLAGSSAAFRNDDLSAIDATTTGRVAEGSVTGAHLACPATGVAIASAGDGHGIEMPGPHSTANTLRFEMEDVTLDTAAGEAVSCVTGLSATYKGGAPLGTLTLNLRESVGATNFGTMGSTTTATTVTVDRFRNGTTNVGKRVGPPTGGWTQATINALQMTYSVNTNVANASTLYWGLSWFGCEVHITLASEPTGYPPLGCQQRFTAQVV